MRVYINLNFLKFTNKKRIKSIWYFLPTFCVTFKVYVENDKS